jgi:hypothetical protein
MKVLASLKLSYTFHMTWIIASENDLSSCVRLSSVVTEHNNKINQMVKEICYYRINVLKAVTDNDCYLWIRFAFIQLIWKNKLLYLNLTYCAVCPWLVIWIISTYSEINLICSFEQYSTEDRNYIVDYMQMYYCRDFYWQFSYKSLCI